MKLDVFPVTSRHHNHRLNTKATATELNISPEMVRQHIAKVLRYLQEGGQLPPDEDHCYRCQAIGNKIQQLPNTKAGNKQYFCLQCQKPFVLQI